MVGDRCLGRRQARETYTASPTNTILKRSRSGPPVFAHFLSIIRIGAGKAFNSISRQVFERTHQQPHARKPPASAQISLKWTMRK